MSDFEPYADWLHGLAYLSGVQTRNLPAWQRPIAFVQQLAVAHLNNGAGSLFYNHPDKIGPVVESLAMIGEPELADLVRSISKNVAPVLRKGGADLQARLAVCIDGPEAPLCERLDKLIEERWSELHRKMRALADAGGWRP